MFLPEDNSLKTILQVFAAGLLVGGVPQSRAASQPDSSAMVKVWVILYI